ncbi:uncharacterized protein LOC120139419 [Hibiscus syriacus]|uniref:uncharacterized protein LOC120139419 n=1 Tax=Hibiscus syriacus TaxID=106335 RepID=UPI0019223CFB|nr:uncharacterized protein LOC120139419 [Hibiscus syriacus]
MCVGGSMCIIFVGTSSTSSSSESMLNCVILAERIVQSQHHPHLAHEEVFSGGDESSSTVSKFRSNKLNVVSGGPWMIYGSYLTVQPWSRQFSTAEDHPQMILVWVRLRGLPYRYYAKSLFRAIAGALGKIVKIDYNTTEGKRGSFARLAIAVDLGKPLTPGLMIDGSYQGSSMKVCQRYAILVVPQRKRRQPLNTKAGRVDGNGTDKQKSSGAAVLVRWLIKKVSRPNKGLNRSKLVENRGAKLMLTVEKVVAGGDVTRNENRKEVRTEFVVVNNLENSVQLRAMDTNGKHTVINIEDEIRRRILTENNGRPSRGIKNGSSSKKGEQFMAAARG